MKSSHAGTDSPPSLPRLFVSFLRLGATAFGGPAMAAYIRKMAVEQNQWLDEGTFQDGVALCQTIPGATAMQTAAYVGLRARGLAGAAACFVGFGLPAFCLMAILSASYTHTHGLPSLVAVFQGLRAMTVAIVAHAAFAFGKRSLKRPADLFIAGLIVDVRSWMDGETFMNGIALGQVTPGPIVITATFVGYFLYGIPGAVVATATIFLPSFLMVVGIVPYFDRLRASDRFHRCMVGILASFVGLLVSVTIQFALDIPWDAPRTALAGAALAALLARVDVLWVVLIGIAVSLMVL